MYMYKYMYMHMYIVHVLQYEYMYIGPSSYRNHMLLVGTYRVGRNR